MNSSTCPNCHQPVAAADDICENCGAVLTTLSGAPVRAPSPAPAATSTSGMTACPQCGQAIAAGSDICEECGAVLTKSAFSNLPPVQETCPQCHRPRTPGVKFCNQCGYRFATVTGQTAGAAPPPPAPTQLAVGDVLGGKYTIVKEIGSGGMGAVYLAEDQVLKRRVVIKALLSNNDPDLVAQSVKEREFLAAVKHANIVSIYDFISVGTRGYIVMEYVQGKTLEQIMEEQGYPFDAADAIKYTLGILPAFSYLAKLGLVYCDFKPQNVMLEILKDGTQVIKLIDLY
jgi:serine/threonine-protein kinase PknG